MGTARDRQGKGRSTGRARQASQGLGPEGQLLAPVGRDRTRRQSEVGRSRRPDVQTAWVGTAMADTGPGEGGEPMAWAPQCDRLVARVTTCSGALSAGGLPDLDGEQIRVGASREAPPGKRGPSWGPGGTGSHRCKHFTPKQVRELKTTLPQACPAASVTHCTKGPSRGPLRSKTLGL